MFEIFNVYSASSVIYLLIYKFLYYNNGIWDRYSAEYHFTRTLSSS